MNKRVYTVLFGVVILLVAIFIIFNAKKESSTGLSLDSFAICLKEKGLTMYGAKWCPHCQREKKAFGDSFKYIPYVECPDQPKICLDLKVDSYPTWIFPDGRRLVGEQGLGNLSKMSGCSF